MSNGIICFRQLRRTAEVVNQASHFKDNDEQLTHSLWKGLLPSVTSDDVRIRVQVKLAILEFQRVANLDLKIEETLDTLAYECDNNNFRLLKEMICTDYDGDQMISLIDWLIRLIGSQVSIVMSEQQSKSKRDRKAKVRQHVMAFESAAVLLHCMFELNQDTYHLLSSSHFHVVALEAYIKANKDDENVMLSCCRFYTLLSMSVKLELLSSDFSRRQRRLEQEQMYADIYAGSDYRRGANEETMNRRLLEINRVNILADSSDLLKGNRKSLWNGIHVKFIGEEGQDAGGLLKEWMLMLCKELVPLVFCQVEKEGANREIRAECTASDSQLMGVIIGLSIRHCIPLDMTLPHYIYRHLFSPSGDSNALTLEDLGQVRPSLAKGLAEMLLWGEEGFSERLSMNFSYQSRLQGDAIPLLPNGGEIPVTYLNRELYVQRLCSFILQEQNQTQLQALHVGLEQVCQDLISLQLFSMDEIDGLVCGQEIALDVVSLRRISTVDGPSRSDGYIEDFWNVLEHANDQSILQRLLHFITANHRIPLTSSPHEATIVFHIVILHGKEFTERLPTASTCTNTLFLPRYPTIEQLRSRLFIALRQGSVGFGLK